MRNSPAIALLIAIALGLPVSAAAADRSQILQAINQVENPSNRTRPGAKGELGPYQFRLETWRMHTNLPFSRANDRAAADEVAASHFEWIKRGLVKAGIEPSPFNIALAWNAGLHAVTSHRTAAASRRYATRVANLVAEAEHLQRVAELRNLGAIFLASGDKSLVPAR